MPDQTLVALPRPSTSDTSSLAARSPDNRLTLSAGVGLVHEGKAPALPRDAHGLQEVITTAFIPSPEAFAPQPSPVPAVKSASAKKGGNRRRLKTAFGLVLLGVFGAYPIYTLMQPSSAEAVLNARLVTLRSPINGRVDASPRVDDARVVSHGTELLTVRNDRADRSRLEDLQSQLGRLGNEQAAALAKLRHAEGERAGLLDVANRFRDGRIAQLMSRKAELEDEMARAALRRDEAASTLQRYTLLAGTGTLSTAELDRATRDATKASLDQKSLLHRIAPIDRELQAAQAGIFIGDGSNNDRPSSFQRAEAVGNEIAALIIDRDRNAAEMNRLTTELATETERFDLLSSAMLRVPVDGRVWERLVSPGEEVGSGQALLRLVDCATTLITANVTEGVYNGLMVGTKARFIPADGGDDLSGQVVNLTGMANAAANFAIEPSSLRKEPYRVMIGLSGSQNSSCSIGRTGRVVFNKTAASAP